MLHLCFSPSSCGVGVFLFMSVHYWFTQTNLQYCVVRYVVADVMLMVDEWMVMVDEWMVMIVCGSYGCGVWYQQSDARV